MAGNLTRINNNQITDASGANTQLGINATTKVQNYTVTSQKIANNLTYGSDLTISGNLTVMGNSTQIDTTIVAIEDPIILLASNQTGAPTVDIGFIGQRGTANNIAFVWDEALDKFATVFTDSSAGDVNVNILDYANLLTGNLSVVDLISTVNISLTGNVLSDLYITGNGIASNFYTVGGVSATGLIRGGNFATAGNVSATGNIFGNAILASTLSLSGNVFSPLNVTGNLAAGNISTSGTFNVTGNLSGNNFIANNKFTFSTSNASITDSSGSVQLNPDIALDANNGVIIGGNGYLLSLNGSRNAQLNYNSVNGQLGIYQANVYGNTQSTSYTSGAVTIAGVGGLGVGGNAYIQGLVSVNGTIYGSNVSASGNIDIANIAATGQISASGNIYTGSNAIVTGYITSASETVTGNVTAGNVLTAGLISATGNITSSTFVNAQNVSATANVTSGNVLTDGLISVGGTVTAVGNINGGNILTANVVSAGGNIYTAANISATGLITATGNVIGGNLVTVGTANVYTLQVNENANISGYASVVGNVYANNISASLTVSSTNVIATYANVSGNVDAGNVSVLGNVLTSNVIVTGLVSVAGNVTAANFTTSGTQGNITGANVISAITFTASGNITGNNISSVNDVNVGVNLSVTANVAGGNLSIASDTSLNNLSVTGTAQFDTTVTVTGNVTAGNIGTAILSANGNIYGNLISAASNVVTGVAGSVNAFQVNTATIVSANTLNISTSNSALSINTGTANVNFNGAVLNNVALPQQSYDAANKAYVDATAQGLSPKDSCDVGSVTYLANTAMTTNVVYYNGPANDGLGATLTVTTTSNLYLDGINLAIVYATKGSASRILIKNEGTQGATIAEGAWNGIYNITAFSSTSVTLTRSSDFDTPAEIYSAYVFIQQGDTLADTSWTCTNNATAPVTIGTTFINWTQFSGAGTYTAGAGLSLNGTVFGALVDNVTTYINGTNQIAVLANAQIANPNIGNATYSSLDWTGAGSGSIKGVSVSLSGGIQASANVSTSGNVLAAGYASAANVYVTNLGNTGVVYGATTAQGTQLTQDNSFTYNVANATLSANNLSIANSISAGNITDTTLTQNSVVFAGAGGLLSQDTANLTYTTATGVLTTANMSATGYVSAAGNVFGGRLYATGMTPSSVTFVSTNGLLQESTGLTYDVANTRLTANNTNVTTMLTSANITDTALTQYSVVFAGSGGLLTQDNANFTFNNTTGVLLATNLSTTGNVTATGNISGGNVLARNLNANSIVFAGADGLLTQSANITYNPVANVLNVYSLSAVANITTDNLTVNGTSAVTGNIGAGNFITAGNVFFSSEYSGLQFPGGGSVTEAGPYNVEIQGPDQVIVITNTNHQWTFKSDGVFSSPNDTTTIANVGISTAGNVSVSGNVNSGLNLRATSTTLNDTGNGAWAGTVANATNVTGFFNTSGNTLLTLGANPGVMSLQLDGSLFIGDNVGSDPYTINASYGGWLVAGSGIKSFGDIDSDANIHASNLIANNTVYTTDVSTSGNVYTDGFISVTGNIISNASILGNVFSATGNIFAAGYASITGNIVSNASILGNVFSASGNINTAADISATGNITAGNFITSLAANIGNINIQGTTITTDGSDPLYVNTVGDSIDFAVNGPVANLLFVSGLANSVAIGSNLLTDGATFAVNASDSMVVPVGNSYQRPGTPATGMFRWNTTINSLEAYSGTTWQTVGTPDFTLITNEQFNGDGTTLSYALTGNGLSTNACIVTINGVVQIPVTAYAVTGTPGSGSTLTFTEAPQAGDVIDVREITSTKTVNGIGGNGQAGISVVNNDLVVIGNIVPTPASTYNLGNAAQPWNSLYVSGNTIYLGEMQLKAYGNTFGVYDSANNLATINAGNLAVDSINYGDTSIGIPVASGNAVIIVNNNTITTFAETGITIFGTLSAQGTTTLSNVTATGNIATSNYLATGLASIAGNVTGGNLLTAGVISTSGRIISNTNILGATVSVTGALTVGTFANVTGNVNGGNISTSGRLSAGGNVYGNLAQFYGTAVTGVSAIYAGLNTGFTSLPNVVVQTSTSANSYTQFNSQNINSGTQSSTEYVATASNGDDTNNFIDMGIAGGNWDGTQPNSLGDAVFANDGFLYVQGGTGGGNLVLATSSGSKVVKIVTGGAGAANLVATFNASGTVSSNTTTGALVVEGGLGVSGTLNASSLGVTTLSVAGLTMTGNTIVSAGTNLTLDPNGSGSTDGNVIIAGNLQVQGTTTTINSNTVSINDLVFNVANNAATASQANGGGLGVGPVGSEYARLTFNNVSNAWNTNIGVSVTGAILASGNVTAQNLTTTGVITATGTVTGGNIITGGNISTSGSIIGAVANVTAYVGGTMTLTGNITGGNLAGTNLSGTLIAGPQTGINAVGTLVSLTVTGNVTGGNIFTNGAISSAGNITANVYIGNGAALTGVTATGVGTLTNLTVTGNVVAGNVRSAGLSLSGTVTSDLIPAANVTYSLGNTTNRWKDLWISNSTIYLGNTTLSATSAGLTVNGVDVVTTTSSGPISTTGNVTSGNVTASGAITIGSAGVTTAIVNGGTSGVGNIGTAATPFNMVYALATSAQYADLAEKYTADAEYAPGTVVAFGGEAEVTASTADSDRRVAGVVSTNPSYIMNGGLIGKHVVTVALTGRVPCRVTGPVRKGDLMVSNGDGTARADADPKVGTVIGKALADHAGGVGVIEVVVGRV